MRIFFAFFSVTFMLTPSHYSSFPHPFFSPHLLSPSLLVEVRRLFMESVPFLPTSLMQMQCNIFHARIVYSKFFPVSIVSIFFISNHNHIIFLS